MTPMPERFRALLFLNGIGLFVFSMLVGWHWMFALLGEIVLWPFVPPIDIQIPGEERAWRMVHMEAITQGLLLMAWGLGGGFIRLGALAHRVFFWCALAAAWLFTVPPLFNALFGTRGLAMGGGPFKGGLANDIIFVVGWPPVMAVHVLMGLAVLGRAKASFQTDSWMFGVEC